MISKIQSLFHWDDSWCLTRALSILPKKGAPLREQVKIHGERISLESSIDLDLITLHQAKELSLQLFDKTSLENCLVKNIHLKVLSYSFLGRTTTIQIPTPLKIDAIETVHLFMNKELNKKQKGPFKDFKEKQLYIDLLLKWHQFYQRVKTNGSYLEFSSDATIRKKEYLEVSNLLLFATQALDKLPFTTKGEIISSLPLIICEDIDKCKTGLLSRIHHNILPFCM
ncbi:MAG: hypothetical protein EB053_06780, partial [Chlamydiae bacterium]|nr:hypothetical protein [Chlamydiota bacterium]